MGLVTTEAARESTGILRAATARSWSPAVFGVVPSGANRRRPTDIVRVGVAAIAVVVTGIGAHVLAPVEQKIFDLLTALPGWFMRASLPRLRTSCSGAIASAAADDHARRNKTGATSSLLPVARSR